MNADEESRELLEAYWQGSLDRAAAERLARTLRAGDATSAALMDEIEFASLLHQAEDNASGEELVRAFFSGMGIDGILGAQPPVVTPNRWKRRAWMAAAAAGILVVAGLFLALRAQPTGGRTPTVASDPQQDPTAAQVGAIIAGDAEVRSRGAKEFVPAQVGGMLSAGDTIRVGANGPVEIDLGDSVQVLLDAGSEAVIAPDPALTCAISLESGQLFADVVKGSPFSVLTSEGNVQSLGTRFAVTFAGLTGASDEAAERLVVSVEEGVVEVMAGGEVSRVESGRSLVVRSGVPPRIESGEGTRRRLGWVEKWRGGGGGNGRGRGHGAGPQQGGGQHPRGGPQQGGTRGRGGHGGGGR